MRTGRPVCDPVPPEGVDTSPKGDIPPDIGSRSAEHRRLSPHSAEIPSPGRVRPMKRPLFGAVASRLNAVVCAYVHNCCASTHERLIPGSSPPSFVPTFTTVVNLDTNDRRRGSNLFQWSPVCGTLRECPTLTASSPSSRVASMVYSATGKPSRWERPADRSSTGVPAAPGSISITPYTHSIHRRRHGIDR